jgi:histidinol-phosphate/aromatic aminotransferase/cobyric acid decarboxylase-like protein
LIASKLIIAQVANLHVPWSVNGLAQRFFVAAIQGAVGEVNNFSPHGDDLLARQIRRSLFRVFDQID